MNGFDMLVTRRSVRAYRDDPIDDEVLAHVIEAGVYAPTGLNRQSPIIVAVTNRELRDRLSRMNAQIMGVDSDPFYGAPVVLVVLADRSAAAGFTGQKRSSTRPRAGRSWPTWASRETTRASATASWATPRGSSPTPSRARRTTCTTWHKAGCPYSW